MAHVELSQSSSSPSFFYVRTYKVSVKVVHIFCSITYCFSIFLTRTQKVLDCKEGRFHTTGKGFTRVNCILTFTVRLKTLKPLSYLFHSPVGPTHLHFYTLWSMSFLSNEKNLGQGDCFVCWTFSWSVIMFYNEFDLIWGQWTKSNKLNLGDPSSLP